MNPKQRLLAALRRQPVDRLPAMTHNFCPFADGWRRQADGTYARLPAYQPMIDAVWRTDTGMLVKVSARYAGDRQERTWSEQHVEGTSSVTITYLETPRGRLHTRFVKPGGQPGYHVKSLIAGQEDLEKNRSLPASRRPSAGEGLLLFLLHRRPRGRHTAHAVSRDICRAGDAL